VKSHLSVIFRVLDVQNRTQAVIAAQRLGLRVPFTPSAPPPR
jgi:DNA-binding NarL/FixJ family response regulator